MPTTGYLPASPGAFGYTTGTNLDQSINGPGKVTIFGHSYFDTTQGVNAAGQTPPYCNTDQSLFRQTLSALDVPEAQSANYAIPGAVLCQDNSGTNAFGAGGHVQVLQYYSPINIRQGAAAGLKAPWSANQGLSVLCWGINDITVYAATSEAGRYKSLFIEAYRTVLSRLRSAAVFESITDTATAYSGGGLGGANWSQVNDTKVNSGTGYARTATVGATATITLPSDYPGGKLALGFIGRKGATGGQANITVDGVLVGTINTSNITADAGATFATAIVLTKRLDLTAGAHTVVITTTGIDGNFDYNYYQYEAAEPNPVIICNINRLRSYPNGSTQGDQLVADWNALINTVITEFGGPIEIANFDNAVNQTQAQSAYNNNRLSWDNLHLSEIGARYAASAILDAYIRLCQDETVLAQTTTSYRDSLGFGIYQPIVPLSNGVHIVSPGMVGSAATVTPTVNRILLIPFVIPRPCILNAIYFQNVTVANGGGTFKAGLYYDRQHVGVAPNLLTYGCGNKLFDWGTLTATVASPKILNLPTANGTRILTPGVYFLALLPDAGVTLTCSSMTGASPYLLTTALAGPLNASCYEISRTATFTSLPGTFSTNDPGFAINTLNAAPWAVLTTAVSQTL